MRRRRQVDHTHQRRPRFLSGCRDPAWLWAYTPSATIRTLIGCPRHSCAPCRADHIHWVTQAAMWARVRSAQRTNVSSCRIFAQRIRNQTTTQGRPSAGLGRSAAKSRDYLRVQKRRARDGECPTKSWELAVLGPCSAEQHQRRSRHGEPARKPPRRCVQPGSVTSLDDVAAATTATVAGITSPTSEIAAIGVAPATSDDDGRIFGPHAPPRSAGRTGTLPGAASVVSAEPSPAAGVDHAPG
jgi:hypothetical protein